PGSGGLDASDGIAIGPDGNIYVSDNGVNSHINAIFRYNGTTASPLPAQGRSGAIFVEDDPNTPNVDESGGYSGAADLAFGPDGNLYAPSVNTNQILRFQGPGGASPGAFMNAFVSNTPVGWLLFEPDGNLYSQGN